MLELPTNFRNDLQGKDTAIFPLVTIGNWTDDGWAGEPYYISTNVSQWGSISALPILLNIPSLKESIDIETRRYKISSVNIDISNFPYEGKRFSELVGDSSLINTECRIFWASPSARNVQIPDYYGTDSYEDDSVFEVYFGTIRRYTHDDEKVKLVVEDRSQATLHKDLPIEQHYLTGAEVPDKYKNKPIPMVYGHVDRSPCVVSTLSDTNGEILLLFDNDLSTSALYTEDETWEVNDKYNHSKLFLFDSIFADVAETTEVAESTSSYTQWTNVGNKIIFPKIATREVWQEGGSGTLSDYNLIELHYIVRPDRIKGYLDTDYEPNVALLYDYIQNPEHLLDADPNNYLRISDLNLYSSWIGTQASTSPFYAGTLGFEFNNHLGLDFSTLRSSVLINAQLISSNEPDPTIYMNWNFILWEDNFGFDNYWLLSDDTANSGLSQERDGRYNNASNYNIPDGSLEVDLNNSTPLAWSNLDDVIPANLWLVMYMNYGTTTQQPDIRVASIAYFIKGEYIYNNFAALDFYANVNGRNYLQTSTMAETTQQIIATILLSELGQPVPTTFSSADYDTWKYAFTVDKKINSKKLIEGLASASPYIPRFDNKGEFKFDVIPMDGGTAEDTIKEADVIDFSFSRTKIEDVYTKIEFKNNWDYARGEFNSSVIADATDVFGDTIFDYYGFTVPTDVDEHDNRIHPDSTLVIDDSRGKYIRNDDTARDFAEWYLLWSCNQHLKLKIKLPLKYMNLEIGDMVDFDAILGEVEPYGIDYTDTDYVNGQEVFKNFLITSTNKTLEFCEIECIQMHDLQRIYYSTDTTFNAEEYYTVTASFDLDGVPVEDIHEFEELVNLVYIENDIGEQMNFGDFGWFTTGEAFAIEGGSQYTIVFSADTTTNLFALVDSSTGTIIDDINYHIGNIGGTSGEIYNRDLINGIFFISDLSIKIKSNITVIKEAKIIINAIEYDADITTDGNSQLLTFFENTPVTIFNVNKMEDIDIRNYIYTFTLTTSDLETFSVHRNIIYTFNRYSDIGDINGDGQHNILDVVALANSIIAGNCSDIEDGYPCDLNGDGGYSILDIVSLANYIPSRNR